jgi:hypothetical protein
VLAYLAAVFLVCTAPARADTIVEDLSFNGSVENGGVFVTGPLFNPALGTLTSVSATVTGVYDASMFLPGTGFPPSIEYSLHGNFTAPGPFGTQPLALGQFLVSGNGGGTYSGRIGFDYTEAVMPFGSYVEGAPNPAAFLAGLDFYAFPTNGGGLGASSDFSTWSGTLAITYTYTVPEPGSVLVLALGAAACRLSRRRRS